MLSKISKRFENFTTFTSFECFHFLAQNAIDFWGTVGHLDFSFQAHDEAITNLRADFEREAREIELKYERKMRALRDELDLRRKTEIHEIEERKNSQINTLMKNHERAFSEIKNYYNDITLNNLALINTLKVSSFDSSSQKGMFTNFSDEVVNNDSACLIAGTSWGYEEKGRKNGKTHGRSEKTLFAMVENNHKTVILSSRWTCPVMLKTELFSEHINLRKGHSQNALLSRWRQKTSDWWNLCKEQRRKWRSWGGSLPTTTKISSRSQWVEAFAERL